MLFRSDEARAQFYTAAASPRRPSPKACPAQADSSCQSWTRQLAVPQQLPGSSRFLAKLAQKRQSTQLQQLSQSHFLHRSGAGSAPLRGCPAQPVAQLRVAEPPAVASLAEALGTSTAATQVWTLTSAVVEREPAPATLLPAAPTKTAAPVPGPAPNSEQLWRNFCQAVQAAAETLCQTWSDWSGAKPPGTSNSTRSDL